MNDAAFVVLWIGSLCGAICAVAAFVEFNSESSGAVYFAWVNVVGAIASALVGYLISLAFKAAAEMMRLIKRQAGLPVGGRFAFRCSVCQTQFPNASVEGCVCPDCGAKLEK